MYKHKKATSRVAFITQFNRLTNYFVALILKVTSMSLDTIPFLAVACNFSVKLIFSLS